MHLDMQCLSAVQVAGHQVQSGYDSWAWTTSRCHFYRIEIHRKSSGSTALWKNWRVTSGSCLLWSRSGKYASCFQRYCAFWLPVCGFRCVRERDLVWASRYLKEMYFGGFMNMATYITQYFLCFCFFVFFFSKSGLLWLWSFFRELCLSFSLLNT